jgi:hypothetical protein
MVCLAWTRFSVVWNARQNFFFLAQWEGVKATRCRATTKNVGVPASAGKGKTSTEKKEKTDSRKKLFQRRRRWWTTGLNIFFGPP